MRTHFRLHVGRNDRPRINRFCCSGRPPAHLGRSRASHGRCSEDRLRKPLPPHGRLSSAYHVVRALVRSGSPADRRRTGRHRKRRAEEMQAATYAVSEAAHNATDLAALFREIHRIIAKLVAVAEFAVATRDRQTRQLRFSYQMDAHGNLPDIQETIARRYCDDVIRERKLMLLPDEALVAPSTGAASMDRACWLVMPLVTQKEAIGALLLKSVPGTVYSEKDKELLHFVSAQVATAIERGQLNAELLRSAQNDELTGLPNRRLFQDRMKSALARCQRMQCRAAVLFGDIDDFKQVNDSLGHAIGDLLLQEIALRLGQCERKEDMVAGMGGDEFVVLLEKIRMPEDALAVAAKIREAMLPPVNVDG